jgi:ABC-type multidrug transport system fused ATPase/permease subunit
VALGVALGHVALGSGPAPTAALVEGACAGAALLIVLTGWWGGLHEHWLLARHRAERLRLLRWGLLVEPRLWSTAADGIERAEREFRESFARVRRLGPLQMGDWASGSWQFLPPAPPGADEGDRDWSDVAAYYRTRRLEPQLAYFREAARRGERWGQLAEIFILGAFFVGVGLELAAVVVGWWSGHEAVARWLLFFGLLLPILAAAARIVRSAFEFGRNEDRCRATAASLERCQGRLDAASDGASIRLSLWASERVLEAEHREWLRLMLKAAWFG